MMNVHTQTNQASRKEVLPAFLMVVTVALAVYGLLEAIGPRIQENAFLYSFGDLISGCAEGSLKFRLLWLLTDLTEGSFMVTILGSILMSLVAPISAHLERKGSPHAGTGVDGNGRNFGAMFLSAFASILLSQLIYGQRAWFATYGFIPTFSALLVSQAMIACYGQTPPKIVTAIVLGGMLPCPISFLIMKYITIPLGLPGFISVSLGLLVTIPMIITMQTVTRSAQKGMKGCRQTVAFLVKLS